MSKNLFTGVCTYLSYIVPFVLLGSILKPMQLLNPSISWTLILAPLWAPAVGAIVTKLAYWLLDILGIKLNIVKQ